jgi:rubrerythrin
MMATNDNLQTAFAGESQANRKYTAFARKAEGEGFRNVARMFRAIAEAETVHALSHFRVMGHIKGTADNLQAAMDGENYEVRQMYPPMYAEAEKDGNKPAMASFRHALEAEKIHAEMYAKALESVKAGKDAEVGAIWICDVCGHTVTGEPPERCPICNAKRERYFEVK